MRSCSYMYNIVSFPDPQWDHTSAAHRHVAKYVLHVLFLIISTGLRPSIGVTCSYSSRPFLCALVMYICKAQSHSQTLSGSYLRSGNETKQQACKVNQRVVHFLFYSVPHTLPVCTCTCDYSLCHCLYIIVNQISISWPNRDIYVRMLARKKLKLNTDTTEDPPSVYPSTSPSSRSPVALALTPAKPGPSLSHTPSTKAGMNP